MYGNRPLRGLYKKSEKVIITAGDSVADNFTVTTGRGNIQAIGIVTNSDDLDIVSLVDFTLNDGGMSFIENDNLLRWSPQYRGNGIVTLPIEIAEGQVVNYNFNNTSGEDVIVIIEQYFYNPQLPVLD